MEKTDMTKGSVEFNAYKDLFDFHKAYGIPEPGNSQYWIALVDKAAEINARYAKTAMAEIVSRHLIGLMTMFDKEAKE